MESDRMLLSRSRNLKTATGRRAWHRRGNVGEKDGKPVRLISRIGPASKTNMDKRRARFSQGQLRAASLHELRWSSLLF